MEHFMELRYRLRSVANHHSIYVSLDELANILYCSTRNVKRILKNMEDEGLIYWKPGGGRGNRSKLLFRKSLEEMLPSHIHALVDRGEYRQAIRWLKREGIPGHVRERCYKYVLRELSFPRIDVSEMDQLNRNRPAAITPAIISTSTGRWFFVDGGQGRKRDK
ncbi:SgrR family transcriptional regulator [Laceyella putida]|uniref:SgrR family transcriptional regulator n=1 Tax=Laceyella putida TaxID=110101 RepID=A0ABW2RKR3_9BACL